MSIAKPCRLSPHGGSQTFSKMDAYRDRAHFIVYVVFYSKCSIKKLIQTDLNPRKKIFSKMLLIDLKSLFLTTICFKVETCYFKSEKF